MAAPASPDIVSGQFFDQVLAFFQYYSVSGLKNLYPHVHELLLIFAILDIAFTWHFYEGQMKVSEVIGKIIKYGFLMVVISMFNDLCEQISQSFQYAGFVAAGQDPSTFRVIGPSGIFDMGLDSCGELFKALKGLSWYQFANILFYLLCILLCLAAFFLMSIQVLFTKIEFYVFSTLALLLVPFGAFRFTQSFFQRAISGLFSFGTKLMVMSFMIGLTQTFIRDISLSASDTFSVLIGRCFSVLTIGILVWKLPELAANVMSGTPSFNGSGIMGSALMGAAAFGGAVTGGAVATLRGGREAAAAANGGMMSKAGAAMKGAAQTAMHGTKRAAGSYLRNNTRIGRGYRGGTRLAMDDDEYAISYWR